MIDSSFALVEITKHVLETAQEVKLKHKGNCMWPVLRDGDIVKIRKINRESLKFGDVGIYQTTAQTFHANILFNASLVSSEASTSGYLGKVVEIERRGKVLELDPRPFWFRVFQALLCPSNPYGLGLPAYWFRKFFRKY